MVSSRVLSCVWVLLFAVAGSAAETAQYEGLSLSDLNAEIAKGKPPLMTRFSDGFAVIQTLPYEKTVKEFVDNSRAGYDAALVGKYDFKVNKLTEEEFEIEAVGLHRGGGGAPPRRLHFIVRGILSEGKMYVFTATTAEGSWDAMGTTLKNYVESFHK